MKHPDGYDDVAPSAPCAIAPGGTWQEHQQHGYYSAGLPVSQAALQPNYSATGPGGIPAPPAIHYQYHDGTLYAAGPPGAGLGAPLLVPAPQMGGAGPGGFFPGATAAAGDFGLGTDLLYASRSMRHAFLRKVLGIVCAQLLLTAAIAAPIVLSPAPRAWLASNRWAVTLSVIVTFSMLICLTCSEGARRSYPSNLLLLGAFTAAQGVLVGVACAAYQTPTVLMAVVLTAAVCLALVLYALQTKFDFTAAGGMLYSATWILLLVMLASALLRLRTLDLLIAGCGALVFCCYLVYDVQLLISGDHSCAISVDEPIVAALNIYVDLVNVFLFILQLLGRDED